MFVSAACLRACFHGPEHQWLRAEQTHLVQLLAAALYGAHCQYLAVFRSLCEAAGSQGSQPGAERMNAVLHAAATAGAYHLGWHKHPAAICCSFRPPLLLDSRERLQVASKHFKACAQAIEQATEYPSTPQEHLYSSVPEYGTQIRELEHTSCNCATRAVKPARVDSLADRSNTSVKL